MKYGSQILIPTLTAFLLIACSADDGPGKDYKTVPEGVISYTVETALTRTAITGTLFPSDEQFCIYAYKATDGSVVIPGKEVMCLSSGVWATNDNYYWPDDGSSVNFFAIYPKDLTFDALTKSIDYVVPVAINQQKDVMYETVTKSRDDVVTTGNAVPLTMHHALSQVTFKGKVSSSNKDWTVHVSKIKLCNIKSSGTFNLSTKTWKGFSVPKSYPLSMKSELQTLTFYKSDGTTEAAATNLTADDGALLLIPQSLTAWNKTVNVSSSENTGAYLEVTLHISRNSTDILGTAASPVKAYVPFDNTESVWQPGKKYIYTLQFGAGLDADGNSLVQSVGITLTATIEDWGTGTVTPNEISAQ